MDNRRDVDFSVCADDIEDDSNYEEGRGVGAKSKISDDRKERDKSGHIVMCGIEGCEYKTGNTTSMKNHKGAKHGIGEKRE